jgi:hypothetical protein
MLFVFFGVFNLILWVKPSKSNFGKYGKYFSLILKGNLIDFEIFFSLRLLIQYWEPASPPHIKYNNNNYP